MQGGTCLACDVSNGLRHLLLVRTENPITDWNYEVVIGTNHFGMVVMDKMVSPQISDTGYRINPMTLVGMRGYVNQLHKQVVAHDRRDK